MAYQIFSVIPRLINRVSQSISITTKIKNTAYHITGFLEWQLGYYDFKLAYDEPIDTKMFQNILYLYSKNNKVFLKLKNNPAFELEVKDFANDEVTFQRIKDSLNPKTVSGKMLAKDKVLVYDFMVANGCKAGLGHKILKNIIIPHQNFENNFIQKHPFIYKSYLNIKKGIKNTIALATSETGFRIITIAILISSAVASGGIVPVAIAGAYGVAVSVALIQQVYSRVYVNRLREEASLLKYYADLVGKKIEYANNKKSKLEIFDKKNIHNHNKSKHPIINWIMSSTNYLSTYLLEVGVPIALVAYSPLSASMSALKFTLTVASSGIAAGVGIYFQRITDNSKEDLKKAIKTAKHKEFIPNYKNLKELRAFIKLEEEKLNRLGIDFSSVNQKNKIVEKTMSQEYITGFSNVISPNNKDILPKNFKNFNDGFINHLSDIEQKFSDTNQRKTSLTLPEKKLEKKIEAFLPELKIIEAQFHKNHHKMVHVNNFSTTKKGVRHD